MTSQQQDFEMFAGDTKKIDIPDGVIDEDTGDPVDLTNAEIEWQLRDKYGDETLVSKLNSGSDLTVTDASAGTFYVMIRPDDTQNQEGDYQHRIIVTESDGTTSTVTVGQITIL